VPRRRILFHGMRVYLYWSSWVRAARVLLIALFCFLRRCRNPQVPRTINSAALSRSLITMQSLACRIAIQQTLAAAHKMHSPHIFPRTHALSLTRAQEFRCSLREEVKMESLTVAPEMRDSRIAH
jgi:hypothetical protein